MSVLSRRIGLAVLTLAFAPGFSRGADAPGPRVREFPLATVAALMRPAATHRVVAPASGRFHLVAAPGPVAAGAVVGRFDDQGLRTAAELAQLRLRAARQAETDYAANAPTRRQEATTLVNEFAGRLAMAESVAKNPALLRDLPPALQAALEHADVAQLRAQLEAARARVARLEQPDADEASAARLQVLDAERAANEAGERLRDSVLTAPLAGTFQPTGPLAEGRSDVVVSAGQEIGVIRDLSRLIAAVPVLSPYLVRVDARATRLEVAGPGSRTFRAEFREAATEPSPVLGESRVLLYAFNAADSQALTGMVQTNIEAHLVFLPTEPVAVIGKMAAALAHPGVFRDGWAAGVSKAWPGWTLACEGENELGCVPAEK